MIILVCKQFHGICVNLQGFLIVNDFFESSELEPCLHAIEGLVNDIAVRLYQANKIDGAFVLLISN